MGDIARNRHVPIQQSQYRPGTAGTRENDVVQIIKQAVNILRNRAPNDGPATLTKRQALWVLAHLVGDIHQPLHVGAIYFDRDCEEVVDPTWWAQASRISALDRLWPRPTEGTISTCRTARAFM